VTTKYPFPPERSLATRIITASLLIGILGFFTFSAWRVLWPRERHTRREPIGSDVMTLDEILAVVGDGQPFSELSSTSRTVAGELQAQADALATEGGLESLWGLDDNFPPGVVVDAVYFCRNDVSTLCGALSALRVQSVVACRKRSMTNDVVVHASDGDWSAVVVACTWSSGRPEQHEVEAAVSAAWNDALERTDSPPTRLPELDLVAESYAASWTDSEADGIGAYQSLQTTAMSATGANRSAITSRRVAGMGDIRASDIAQDFTAAEKNEINSASGLAIGTTVTVTGGRFVVVGVWTWTVPD